MGVYQEKVVHLKRYLSKLFQTKNLERLWYSLAIEVACSNGVVNISQRK